MAIGIRYVRATGELDGRFSCSRDADLALNYDPATQGMIVVPPDHDVNEHPARWRVVDGELVERDP